MFAIAGVSGNTGSIVADALLAQGKKVRVVVRTAAKGDPWKAKGAEVAVAELHDQAALTAALAGMEGAYLLVPPDVTNAKVLESSVAIAKNLGASVSAAKMPHVVLLSSLGAHLATGTGPIQWLHVAEEALRASGAAVTAIRAGMFQENWGGSLSMLEKGLVPAFLPTDVDFPQVSTHDIGQVAAQALVVGGKGFNVIELLGPREYSWDDGANELARITGKPVKAQQFPLEGVVPTFTGFGMSTEMATLYREMFEGLIAGRVAQVAGATNTRVVRGHVGLDATLRTLLAGAAKP